MGEMMLKRKLSGEEVRDARFEVLGKMSETGLANIMGVSRSTIQRIEAKKELTFLEHSAVMQLLLNVKSDWMVCSAKCMNKYGKGETHYLYTKNKELARLTFSQFDYKNFKVFLDEEALKKLHKKYQECFVNVFEPCWGSGEPIIT